LSGKEAKSISSQGGKGTAATYEQANFQSGLETAASSFQSEAKSIARSQKEEKTKGCPRKVSQDIRKSFTNATGSCSRPVKEPTKESIVRKQGQTQSLAAKWARVSELGKPPAKI